VALPKADCCRRDVATRRTVVAGGHQPARRFRRVSLANVEACLTRQHLFSVTVLVWHRLTSALVIAVVVASGRRVLTWLRHHTSG
jgi:hypothetical protein